MKALLFKYVALIIPVFVGCNASTDSTALINEPEASNEIIDLISMEELVNMVDTMKTHTINDEAYKIFIEISSCSEADSIAKQTENPEMALYAFYMLCFAECKIGSDEAVGLVQLYEKSDDSISFWLGPNDSQILPLKEIAADAIYQNNSFTFTDEQSKYLEEHAKNVPLGTIW